MASQGRPGLECMPLSFTVPTSNLMATSRTPMGTSSVVQAQPRALSRRQVVVWVALGATLVLLALQLAPLVAPPSALFSADFGMYWATAHLQFSGENPYDPQKLFPLERRLNPSQNGPIIMYSPPWTLSVLAPLGLL